MIVVGIDPGVTGAVAIIREDASAEVLDLPVVWITKGRGKKKTRRRVYDLPRLACLFSDLSMEDPVTIVIEDVHAMTKQGVTSMFSMGYGVGVLHMGATMCGLPFELVTPQRWKKEMLDGTAKDKAAAYQGAQRLFPGVDLGSRSDHGRAEALLIAEWRRRQG